jgi:hypothetical protein
MALLALPNNLLAGICALVNKKDFQSLRLTCQQIYRLTHSDASLRYEFKLCEVAIDLSHRSLCRLLHLAKVPKFRYKIRTIFLYLPGRTLPSDYADDDEWYKWDRERNGCVFYRYSSEAIDLLAECFRYLANARELFLIELNCEDSHRLVFTAMILAKFPQSSLYYLIQLRRLLDGEYGPFGQSSSSYARYMKWTSTHDQTPEVTWQRFAPDPGTLKEDKDEISAEAKESSKAKRVNMMTKAIEQGYHLKDYRLNKPHIASFFHGLSTVPHLHIDGCSWFPRLRFCNACNDFFAYSIVNVPYTQLTTFVIGHMCVSGGRLQRFIKRQSHTLTHIEIEGVNLTDGSWKTVARVLKQIPGLEQLTPDGNLCQKAEASPTKCRP